MSMYARTDRALECSPRESRRESNPRASQLVNGCNELAHQDVTAYVSFYISEAITELFSRTKTAFNDQILTHSNNCLLVRLENLNRFLYFKFIDDFLGCYLHCLFSQNIC